MGDTHSDALVFFGATGDLAYKKIFPRCRRWPSAARSTCRSSAWPRRAGRSTSCARGRRTASRSTAAWTVPRSHKLCGLLRYVDGDYKDPATFEALRRELGGAEHPAHYLAIPPPLFGPVVEQLAQSGCAKGARVVVEKPFGEDLASARDLNRILLGTFVERDIFRIDHYLGKRPVHNMLFFSLLESAPRSRSGIGPTSRACRSRWRRTSASRAAAASTTRPARSATSSRTIFSNC